MENRNKIPIYLVGHALLPCQGPRPRCLDRAQSDPSHCRAKLFRQVPRAPSDATTDVHDRLWGCGSWGLQE